MTSEEERAQFDGEFYRWTCPICGNVQEEESDPRGDNVECGYCNWKGKVES